MREKENGREKVRGRERAGETDTERERAKHEIERESGRERWR